MLQFLGAVKLSYDKTLNNRLIKKVNITVFYNEVTIIIFQMIELSCTKIVYIPNCNNLILVTFNL